MSNIQLYLASIAISTGLSFLLTPVVRAVALSRGWLDHPASAVKTHKVATPVLGGIAVWAAFAATLVGMRFMTRFPTGTLYSLRAILAGSFLVFLLGVVDDLKKPDGLHFKPKFGVQLAAAILLVCFDIRIHFIKPDYLAVALTLLWVVGITNAMNIIDIMDGLCASQALIASVAFLVIALPSEEVYVSVAASALLGSALGFLPWNLSKGGKIFMGDSGSLVLGFVLAALSCGTHPSRNDPLGVYAPLLILFVPMYDTFFVSVLRMMKGQSPFLGSKDHFALRMEALGFTREQVVVMAGLGAVLLSACAWLITQLTIAWAFLILAFVVLEIGLLSWRIGRIEMK